MDLDSGAAAVVLRYWAALADEAHDRSPDPRWETAQLLIVAAERDAKKAADAVKVLIEQSTQEIFPGLGDPFDQKFDLSEHRWLSRDREESYSDWLAWVLTRQEDTRRILALFGLGPQAVLAKPAIEREKSTPEGRLDIVIHCGALGPLCVEIKTQAEPEDDQLRRYLKWLSTQSPHLGLLLLALDAPEDGCPEGCDFCSWRQFAMGLRVWARDWLRDGRLFEAAMTLSFCAAIERNLLTLDTRGLSALRTIDYLTEWLEYVDDAEKKNK